MRTLATPLTGERTAFSSAALSKDSSISILRSIWLECLAADRESSLNKLIIGCGYLGERLADLWLAEGCRVFATTRSQVRALELKQAGLEPVICDVLDPASLKGIPSVETAVHSIGFDRQSGKSRWDIHVQGLQNLLEAVRPGRFIYISSTGVYGQSAGEEVDENAPTKPRDESGKIMLEAEKLLRRHLSGAIVLRFAGIYGPGRLIGRAAMQAGEPIPGAPDKLLNLIHVEDGAAAVLAAETRAQSGALYNISDDLPVQRRDYYGYLAQLLKAPEPRFVEVEAGPQTSRHERANRRIVNRRMHEELGVQLRYPTYREGVTAILAAQAG